MMSDLPGPSRMMFKSSQSFWDDVQIISVLTIRSIYHPSPSGMKFRPGPSKMMFRSSRSFRDDVQIVWLHAITSTSPYVILR